MMQGGRTLDPAATLADAFVPPCATLQLLPRLRGGGGDGGSTGAESRSCYLEMYLGKRADKVGAKSWVLQVWQGSKAACHHVWAAPFTQLGFAVRVVAGPTHPAKSSRPAGQTRW
jgi:hypothetical protein